MIKYINKMTKAYLFYRQIFWIISLQRIIKNMFIPKINNKRIYYIFCEVQENLKSDVKNLLYKLMFFFYSSFPRTIQNFVD